VPSGRGRRRGLNPHDRAIARLAVPAFGALIAQPLYVLADTAVIGRIGTPQLAGLAVATTVLLTLHSVFVFLAYGTTAAVARRLGARDRPAAADQAVQSLWLALALSVVVAGLGFALADPLVRALGAGEVVRGEALVYLRISLLGLPGMFATLAGTGWLRGLQDLRTPLIIAVLSAAGNLALECVLIFGFGYGIGAAALATVVAQTAGGAVYVQRVAAGARAAGVSIRPRLADAGALLRVGRDLLVRTAALRAALVIATAVAARTGVADLAAHQVAFEVWSFLALSLDAIAIAAQALIGRHLGAGEPDEARAVGDRMLRWGWVAGAVVGVAVLLAREPLARIFSADPEVTALAAFLLLWVAVLQPVNGLVFVLDGLLIGAGDQRYLARAMVVALLAYLPVALVVGVTGLGIGWLWGALGVLMVSRLVGLMARWRAEAWAVTGASR
jgi:putative MATE family efflux protein